MKRSLLSLCVLLLSGLSVSADEATRARLDTCIAYFQDGDYQKTIDSIKALLPLVSDRREEAEAYKYLGFSYVMVQMVEKAKDFFRVALEKFPQMGIDTLEVPPNITIVFKQAQLENKMAKGEILDKSVQERNQKRTVFATVLTSTGAICAGIGGYFFYQAYRSHRDYAAVGSTYPGYQKDLDYFWNRMKKQAYIGSGVSGFAALNLAFGIYLFFKKQPPLPARKAGLFIAPDRFSLALEL